MKVQWFKVHSKAKSRLSLTHLDNPPRPKYSAFGIVNPAQSNPLKTEKSRPNPTQPAGWPKPWTTQRVSHFEDESFEAADCTDNDSKTQRRQPTENTHETNPATNWP